MAKTRRRRSAEEARNEILDAAERELVERGPDGIRLQDLARELGVSHPAILHHFGSRAGLVQQVVARAVERLEAELVETLTAEVDEQIATGILERVLHVLADRKHARTLAWLYLTESDGDQLGHGAQLRRVAKMVHAQRSRHLCEQTPPLEDTLFTVALASMALFGQAVAGAAMQAGGIERAPFLRWFTRLLLHHLEQPQPWPEPADAVDRSP